MPVTFGPPANVRVFQCEWYGADAGTNANVTKTSDAIQQAIDDAYDNGGGTVTLTEPGTYIVKQSFCLPPSVNFMGGVGVVLQQQAANNRTMFRTSNVRMIATASAVTMTGFQILYADTATVEGTGTLTYTSSGTTLTWRAPEDTTGSPVNISAGGFFRVPSGTAGKALYVMAATASGGRPSGNASCTVHVKTFPGAKIITGAVTTNVLTATESGHARKIGDVVEVYRPSTAAVTVTQVLSVTSTAWTAAWTVADFTSEALAAHGTRDISITGAFTIDGNIDNETPNASVEKYPIYFRNASQVTLSDFTIKNASRAIGIYNPVDYKVSNLTGENNGVLIQFEGVGERIVVDNIHAAGSVTLGDDIVAFSQTNATVDSSFTFTGSATIGTMKNVSVSRIFNKKNHICAVKITGYTGSTFDAFFLDSLYSSSSTSPTGAAVIAVVDGASLTGGAIGTMTISNVAWQANTAGVTAEILNFTMTGGAGSITLNEVTYLGTAVPGIAMNAASGTVSSLIINNPRMRNSPTSSFISIAQTVTRVSMNESNFVMGSGGKVIAVTSAASNISSMAMNGGSWTGSSGAYGVYHADGVITNLFLNNIYASAIRNLYESEATADNSPKIQVSNSFVDSTATGFTFRVGATIDIASFGANAVGNNVFQDSAGVSLVVNANGGINTTSSLFLGSGTSRTVKGLNFTQSPAFSATPTFTLSKGNIVTPGVMTAAITAITLADIPPAGEFVRFKFTQDGTGGRNITMPATILFPTGAYTNVGNTANTSTTIFCVSNGTVLIAQGVNSWA